jgi:hypothetical protein
MYGFILLVWLTSEVVGKRGLMFMLLSKRWLFVPSCELLGVS